MSLRLSIEVGRSFNGGGDWKECPNCGSDNLSVYVEIPEHELILKVNAECHECTHQLYDIDYCLD